MDHPWGEQEGIAWIQPRVGEGTGRECPGTSQKWVRAGAWNAQEQPGVGSGTGRGCPGAFLGWVRVRNCLGAS